MEAECRALDLGVESKRKPNPNPIDFLYVNKFSHRLHEFECRLKRLRYTKRFVASQASFHQWMLDFYPLTPVLAQLKGVMT